MNILPYYKQIVQTIREADKITPIKYRNTSECSICFGSKHEGRFVTIRYKTYFVCAHCISLILRGIPGENNTKNESFGKSKSNEDKFREHDFHQYRWAHNVEYRREYYSTTYPKYYGKKEDFEEQQINRKFHCSHCHSQRTTGYSFRRGNLLLTLCTNCSFIFRQENRTHILYTPMGNRR